MGVVRVRFEVLNEVQFSRAFETLAEEMQDLSKPYEDIQNEFYASMSDVFSREGAFEGRTKWADLSPTYRAWKQKHFPGRKILELTGRLIASISVKGSSENISEITPTEMRVGTIVPYAMAHQLGTNRMPARKIIQLTDEQKLRWVQIIRKYLYGLSQKASKSTKRGT